MSGARVRRVTVVVAVFLMASGLLAQTGSTAREALLGLARVRRDVGDPEGARRYFERASRAAPFSAREEAEYFWVLVEVAPAQAVVVGRRLLQAAPGDDDLRERVIAAAAQLGDEKTVVEVASAALDRTPADARWDRRLAESALRRGRARDASRHLADVVAKTGGDDRDRAALALAREAAGDARGAVDAWMTVPEATRTSQSAWTAAFLRVFVATAPPAVAAAAVDDWLRRRPRDLAMRETLVELWARAGEPARALGAIGPLTNRSLTASAAARRWTRREADLALEAGDMPRAIRALDRLSEARGASVVDERRLVDLLIDTGEASRAAARLLAWPCDDAFFEQAQRLPGEVGTDLMFGAVSRQAGACAAASRWARQTLDRLVAVGRHHDARVVADLLPADVAAAADTRRMKGQLALWTGDPAGAIALLEPLLPEVADDPLVIDTLAHAYRSVGRSSDAWEAARPLIADPALDAGRVLWLAEVALEGDAPREAQALLGRLSPGAAGVAALRGRALLALGRPGEARSGLASLAQADLTPPAALALIDSTMAVRGLATALEVARTFAASDGPWRDVFARRVMLETLSHAEEAAPLRAHLAVLDPALAVIVDVEVALAREQPRQALALLGDESADTDRLADLRAIAEGVAPPAEGVAPRGLEILRRLRVTRPRFTTFVVREAELQWRFSLSPDALDRLEQLQASLPEHEPVAVALAQALADGGRHREAINLIERVTAGTEPTVAAQRLRASSERALAEAEARAMVIAPLDDVARARVLASSFHWAESLASLDRQLARDPSHADALRLRADVLSWAGQHRAAITAFDRYLAVAPFDVDARRQQARVAGWAGALVDASRRYASLVASVPGDVVVAAEAAAKTAFHQGRWRAAADGYRSWLALEPDNAEARFELAEAEQAAGRDSAADVERRALEARQGGHREASEARHRATLAARPSGSWFTQVSTAKGYGGGRLIDVRASGGRVEEAWGEANEWLVAAEGARLNAVVADESHIGTRAGVSAAWRRPGVRIDTEIVRTAFDDTERGVTEGVGRLMYQPADRWSLSAGASRHALLESLTSVSRGLAVSGAFAAVAFTTPTTALDLRAARQQVSDGNARTRLTLFASRVVAERWSGLRLVTWAEGLRYRERSLDYYAPKGVLHVDLGAEYTHAFSRARFRGDRERSVTAGYLVGLDTRGQVFRQPTARWSFEVAPGLAIDGRLSRITSADYRETSFTVGLRLGGAARFLSWRD